MDYVSGDDFEQIFITDTNREHLDSILAATQRDYKLFEVKGGEVNLLEDHSAHHLSDLSAVEDKAPNT